MSSISLLINLLYKRDRVLHRLVSSLLIALHPSLYHLQAHHLTLPRIQQVNIYETLQVEDGQRVRRRLAGRDRSRPRQLLVQHRTQEGGRVQGTDSDSPDAYIHLLRL